MEFEQLKLDFNFITEKKYTEETGLELPNTLKKKKILDSKKKNKPKNKKDNIQSNKNINENKIEDTQENKRCTEDIIEEIHEKATENIDKLVDDYKNKANYHSDKNSMQSLKIADTNIDKSSFISAVDESMKLKNDREKDELANSDIAYPYKAIRLMTNAETQLFHFMENNLLLIDRVRIIPKVRLADIIQVDERMTKNKEAFWKISSKHVDFIIVDKDTFDLICVVELDDFYHELDRVKQRDELVYYSLLAAGISLYRVKCKITEINKNHLRGIEESILMYYRKPCPVCGADTRVKSKTSGNRIGHRFYSCTNFPNCRCTVDID